MNWFRHHSHSGQTGFDLSFTLSAKVIKESLCHREIFSQVFNEKKNYNQLSTVLWVQCTLVFDAGIVGGGIGGTSTAYFLRQLFGKNAKIDIFEKKQVGGRLVTTNIGDNEIEAGGTLIHSQNMYMVNFTKLLGIFFPWI